MQGCKQFEPRLFYQISLEDLVPKEHLVRRLADVLDFSWVRSVTASLYSHTGRPSIDPEVVAKLLLLGYLYNISSERQLMRDVQVNLAYRWYLGYDLDEEVPDHSILSKARRRFGLEFFEKLLQVVCLRGAGVCRIGLWVVRHIVAFAELCSFGPFHSDIYFEKNCDIGSG